jgi:hypothetical protein
MSDNAIALLTELDSVAKTQWKKQIQAVRNRVIPSPSYFIQEALRGGLVFDKSTVSTYINDVRSLAWQAYLKEELVFHKEMLSALLEQNEYAATLLASAITEHLEIGTHPPPASALAKVVGQTAGYLTPYLYELCLSSTNSRRSRAGKVFEKLIEHVIVDCYGYPFESQASLGSAFYKQHNLGKMVDGIIPSRSAFERQRSQCVFITMKTSLRERWQQVVEELSRTNIPSAYLLTLDEGLNEAGLQKMNHHNISLVVPNAIKQRLPNAHNLYSFEKFFNITIPICLQHWET